MTKEVKAAIVGGIAVIVAAVISYFAAIGPVRLSIEATRTAEARLTAIASNFTLTPTTPLTPTETPPLPTVTPMNTLGVTPTDTPTLTDTSTPIDTSEPTVILTRVRPNDNAVMVYVPAGKFTMGDNEGAGDQRPAHVIYLEAFWIDKFEVTNAQYRVCVKSNPECWASIYENDSRYNADNQPVVGVNWDKGAFAYCQWVGARLPTEAEWEKAARGIDERLYPWGGDEFDAHRVNSKLDEGPDKFTDGAAPVNSFPDSASPYGALDMSGNVWEWTNSLYMAYPYNNKDGRENIESAENRVVRGGSWNSGIKDEDGIGGLTTTWRSNFTRGTRYPDTGFRCAVSANE